MNADIQSRLDHLEAQLRRQRWISVFSLGLAALAVAWVGQNRLGTMAASTTIEAQRFILRDEKGNQRGAWGIDANNEPSFQIGQPGFPDVYLGRTKSGPSLALHGSTHVHLSARPDAAALTLWGVTNRSLSEEDFETSIEDQAKLASEFCRFGSNGNQFILQSSTGRVDMDAGRTDGNGPWLNMKKDDKVRLSMGKGFYTGNAWRITFKNPNGTPFHETPPTAPPN